MHSALEQRAEKSVGLWSDEPNADDSFSVACVWVSQHEAA